MADKLSVPRGAIIAVWIGIASAMAFVGNGVVGLAPPFVLIPAAIGLIALVVALIRLAPVGLVAARLLVKKGPCDGR